MHWPQITIALGLCASSALTLFAWHRFRGMTRGTWMPPMAQVYRRHGGLFALVPIAEAWVLGQGGFWS